MAVRVRYVAATFSGFLALHLLCSFSGVSGTTGTTLKNEVPVNGELINGQPIEYSWSAVAGQHVTFEIRNPNITSGGEASLLVNNPNGSDGCSLGFNTTTISCNYTPTETGMASATVEGGGGVNHSNGTFTLIYIKDVKATLTSGVLTKSSLGYPGQHADFDWPAVAGRRETFVIKKANITGGEAGLYVENPNGSSGCTLAFESSLATCSLVPSETGSASAVAEGLGGLNPSTGPFKILFAPDITLALKPGISKTVSIKYPGQHADIAWSAVAGQSVTFTITNPNIVGGEAGLYVSNADGTPGCTAVFENASASCQFTPSKTGTTSAVVEGLGGTNPSTGTFTVAYSSP